MTEELIVDRMAAVRAAALQYSEMDRRGRREAVIWKVADPDGRESPDVEERAIHKYLASTGLDGDGLPVVIDAIHGQKPSEAEIAWLLRKVRPDLSRSEVGRLYALLFQVPEKAREDLPSLVSPEDAALMRDVWKLYRDHEAMTANIVWEVGANSSVATLRAKRIRGHSDANRKPFSVEQRKRHARVGGEKELEEEQVGVHEWPTSTRAALYWAVRRMAENRVGLDEAGRVLGPFMQTSLHGCDNREYVDFAGVEDDLDSYDGQTGERVIAERWPVDVVLGGGKVDESNASPVVLDWFARTFVRLMHERGARMPVVGGNGQEMRDIHVSIEWAGKAADGSRLPADCYEWEGDDVSMRRLARVKPDGTLSNLAGAGLDLASLRFGAEYRNEDTGQVVRVEGLGEGFQRIQMELARALRDGPARQHVGEVLIEMAVLFEKRFGSLQSLRE